jgi:hypothetical protein
MFDQKTPIGVKYKLGVRDPKLYGDREKILGYVYTHKVPWKQFLIGGFHHLILELNTKIHNKRTELVHGKR